MERILRALFTERETEAPRGSHTALSVELAGDRLSTLRGLFWLKEEQKGIGAKSVDMSYA